MRDDRSALFNTCRGAQGELLPLLLSRFVSKQPSVVLGGFLFHFLVKLSLQRLQSFDEVSDNMGKFWGEKKATVYT